MSFRAGVPGLAVRFAVSTALLALGCAGGAPGFVDERHPLVGLVWDVRAERYVGEATLVAALLPHRYVLLGEIHDNPAHHRLQARWLRGLARDGRRPAVVFEMIPRERADALAEALARTDATAEDVRRAVEWDTSGWPDFSLYAPVFSAALDAGLPIAAGDLGRRERETLRREGIAGLAPATRAALALDAPLGDAQREALAAAIREGHCDLLPEAAVAGMVDFQRARDARLARSLADAGAAADGAVLVAGAGHVRRDVAVPAALAALDPDAGIASVAIREVRPGATHPADYLREPSAAGPVLFDFVAFTPRAEREDPCERLRRRIEGHAEGAGLAR